MSNLAPDEHGIIYETENRQYQDNHMGACDTYRMAVKVEGDSYEVYLLDIDKHGDVWNATLVGTYGTEREALDAAGSGRVFENFSNGVKNFSNKD